jgi:H+/Cl- antiporter ClcA
MSGDTGTTPPDGGAPGPVPPQMEGRDYLRLLGLGAVIGIPGAIVAVAFLSLVHWLEHWLWVSLPSSMGLTTPPWWLIVALPVVGAVLVWLATRLLPGHGGHEPIYGLSMEPTPTNHAAGVALAALGSLAFGAVLGPEAPLIALGSIMGIAVARWARVEGQGLQVLSMAGSMSAISALFGGPLVAGVMVTEAGLTLGAALVPAMLPGLLGAAIGYTLIVGYGSWTGIPVEGLTIPDLPDYATTRVVDLVAAVVIGLIVAVIVPIVRLVAKRLLDLRGRVGLGPVVVAGGLALGVIAASVQALGGNYADVLFSGQTSIPTLLSTGTEWGLVAVVLAKALAYAISLGSGFRGGPVFPAIFIGTAVAVVIGDAIGMSPTAAVAIGAACGMAAFTRLVVTSLLFAVLLTGVNGAGAIPAATLATVTAWIVAFVIDRRRGAIVPAQTHPTG